MNAVASNTSAFANMTSAPETFEQKCEQVNPKDMPGINPGIGYDDVGKLSLLAIGGGFVLCRRGNCYPMIRTEDEWAAMSDTPPVYAAEQGETFHVEQS